MYVCVRHDGVHWLLRHVGQHHYVSVQEVDTQTVKTSKRRVRHIPANAGITSRHLATSE